MTDIYREVILEHWRNPQNFGRLKNATAIQDASNPYCGDTIRFYVKLKNNKIDEISYEASGCAISRASASIFSEFVRGKTLKQVLKISEKKYMKIVGLQLGAVRIKCSLFVYTVLLSLLKRCIVNNITT